ncbi:MAG TPA: hypothetical protein VJS15_09725, partial [Allosphingosinicella sp.]|nr:hypothetical protein [Allosphingosinicella sp.]
MHDHALWGRREALSAFLSSFLLVALAREARGAVPSAETRVRRWIDAQQDIAEALSRGQLSGRDWALAVERLAGEIDVAALMATVNRSQLRSAGAPFHNDPQKRFVRFID